MTSESGTEDDLEHSRRSAFEGHRVARPAATGPALDDCRTTFSARHLPDVYVARVGYHSAIRIPGADIEWGRHHLLCMPTTGSLHWSLVGTDIVADPGQFVLRSPGTVRHVETTAHTSEIFLAIDPDHLRTLCARLLGRPLQGDVEFATRLCPESPHGQAIRAASEQFLNEPPHCDTCPDRAPRSRDKEARQNYEDQFRDFVAMTLLMHQPHSYWAELRGQTARPAPRDVRRAIDYIHSNLSENVRLTDLIAVSNVPGRTLNEHFRRFTGVSPMAYVRQARLARARSVLMRERDKSVTEIATECGFFHLGRFSADYARAFGESPSTTRARTNPASGTEAG